MRPTVKKPAQGGSHRSQNRPKNNPVDEDRRAKRKINNTEPQSSREGTKRRRRNSSVSDPDEPEGIREVIAGLFRTKCRLYRVTPMKIGELNRNNCRRWSKTIQLALSQNNTYQCNNQDWEYRVEFSNVMDIERAGADAASLQFRIFRKETCSDRRRDHDDFKVVCHGLFVARDALRRQELRELSHLPLLLINGPEGIFKAVKQSIQILYDCLIVPMNDISSSEIKIIAGRYLMTSWIDEDSILDRNSSLTFYFSIEKSKDTVFDHEGSVALKVFINAMERFERRRGEVTNEEVTLMWYDFFNSLNAPILMDFYTPTCKIVMKNFAITNTGTIKVKHLSSRVCVDLLSSLTWCAEGGSSRRRRKALNQLQ